ncbi:metallophosphoesterase [Polaribacter vadi]|uniref:metallophosphoesterase family protein n=1 Tax=Polaribacter TaxID=52959 RepID=UPI001C08528A|nr:MULTISPECIES: metallophosphoesterase [Polaribacter]MBU3012602.1 metallophosphoesterase [Polaribacter vadi]MDO6742419.1 metallophosphoesterase [Polaribacter sp. 1_MG-2023]
MKFIRNLLFIAIAFTLTTCDNFFEYSVYVASVKSEQKNTTAKNLALLKDITISSQDFKFAFVTDVHYSYNNLRTVIEDINKNDDILFVVFGGDIADQALLKEFEIFYDIMKNLNKPYFTVIGNHDYNSNGSIIYNDMFGDFNYSFVFNNNKFVLFDDIIWESGKDPDFDWLADNLSDNLNYNQVFSFAHIPTYVSRDLTPEMIETYQSLMEDNNVSLSLHGHTHSYFYEEGDVDYLIVPSLKDPVYATVQIKDKDFNVELIEL